MVGLLQSLCARPPAPPAATSMEAKTRPVREATKAAMAKTWAGMRFFLVSRPAVAVTERPESPTVTLERRLGSRSLNKLRTSL